MLEHSLQSSFKSIHCWNTNMGPIQKFLLSEELCLKLRTSLPVVTSWMAKGVRLKRREVQGDFTVLFWGDLEGRCCGLQEPALLSSSKPKVLTCVSRWLEGRGKPLNTWKKPPEEVCFTPASEYHCLGDVPTWTESLVGTGPRSWRGGNVRVYNKEELLNIQPCWWHSHPSHLLWF